MEEPEIHAHHHHAPHSGGLNQLVAMFTAIIATLAAICSYFGGHTQNEALYFKNDAVLSRAQASDQWAYYQAKSIKLALLEQRLDQEHDADKAAALKAHIEKYNGELAALRLKAESLEAKSEASNAHAEHALHPHEKLAMAITLFQIAISAASIAALTRRRWLLAAAALSASAASGIWLYAFFA
ncbi:protein of unknown function [Solimonas aquatica]|uniref:DUF4337 domain-containing protein n=1 Tax=Solimonas aquatica TaxID=489703 RepID=A0A1H9L6D2_9GAMM|nr:DUF4337 family protein [Solimonas aquatica]SER06986.1 protein of unknown function [Solimonas aquatica]